MTHRFPIRIYYEDTDLAGVVYYANYLRFAERGRSVAERGIVGIGLAVPLGQQRQPQRHPRWWNRRAVDPGGARPGYRRPHRTGRGHQLL